MNNHLNQVYSNISNEHLLLIDILNNMYNDNLRQISNFTNSINSLNESNSQIRGLLFQILYNQSRRNNRNNNATYLNNINSVMNNSNRFLNFRDNHRDHTSNNQNRTFRLGSFVFDNSVYNDLNTFRGVPITNSNGNGNANANSNNANNVLNQLYQAFLEPVEIYPTQTQIEAATRRVRYSDIVSPKNRSCPIVMEEFNDNDMVTVIRHCGHIFNTDELNRWFSSNCKCPVCRYDIRNYNSTASSEFFNNGNQTSVNSESSTSNNNNQNSSSSREEERLINELDDNFIDNFINLYNRLDSSGNNTTHNPSYLFRLLRR
jgi:hypothetical protein